MAQLRPLPPVLSQYRSDARRISELRGEVRNLSQVLAALRVDVGAYGYEELRQRVLLLEGRLQRCMQKLGRGGGGGRSCAVRCCSSRGSLIGGG